MNPLAVALKPINHGWVVALTDRREVVRFTGSQQNAGRCAMWPASRTPPMIQGSDARPAQARG